MKVSMIPEQSGWGGGERVMPALSVKVCVRILHETLHKMLMQSLQPGPNPLFKASQ